MHRLRRFNQLLSVQFELKYICQLWKLNADFSMLNKDQNALSLPTTYLQIVSRLASHGQIEVNFVCQNFRGRFKGGLGFKPHLGIFKNLIWGFLCRPVIYWGTNSALDCRTKPLNIKKIPRWFPPTPSQWSIPLSIFKPPVSEKLDPSLKWS